MRCFLFFVSFVFFNICSAQSLAEIIDEYQIYQKQQNDLAKTSWPKVSKTEIANTRAIYAKFLDKLSNLNVKETSLDDQINTDLLHLICQDRLDNIDLYSHYMPLNAEGGFLISMMYASNGVQVKDEVSRDNYLSKLHSTPAYIASQINNLEEGLENGITMPKIVVNNCLQLLKKILDSDEFFLLKPFDQAEPELEQTLRSSFEGLLAFLTEEYLPACRNKVGISNNSNGKEFYEQRVRYFTTLAMTPQEVFDIGMREVARIKSEMMVIIKELEFEGNYKEFLDFLRTDEQFYVDEGPELLRYAAWLTTKAQGILPMYFTQLPNLPLTVSPVPSAIAPTYTTGRYSGGSMDNKKAGQYWVNTYNLPARPLYVLPALTLHEGVPGHHLQISLAQELTDIPKFRTSQYLSAYGEGWGLYSEFLGKEAGMYSTLYEDFGRLTYEMWRACRLVVDPGMHYFDWTRERALEFMASNTALSLHEVNTEIDRYIGWPGQAVSYKIGELKIRSLRREAEKVLGPEFDIRLFHDKILENGSVPLSTLEDIVQLWIKEQNEASVEKTK